MIQMQRKIEKRLIYTLTGIMIVVTLLFVSFPDIHRVSLSTDISGSDTYSVMDLLRPREDLYQADNNLYEESHQIRLTLPRDVDARNITYTEDVLSRRIELSIPGVSKSYFYDYPMVGSSDGIRELTFAYAAETGYLDITTTKIRRLSMTVEGNYVYLDFLDPHDIFDAIVVIDAGHGGKDAGTGTNDIRERILIWPSAKSSGNIVIIVTTMWAFIIPGVMIHL